MSLGKIDASDENLRKHFESASKNVTFVSITVQNELINICGSIITDKLIKEVKDSDFYSILCDETSYLAHIEQMSLSVRYVDTTTCTIKENFICFVSVFECTGENLANVIIQKLKELGLSLEFLRCQGYDGGANMSGKYKGVQARILNLQPKTSYTHCASHRLNLTLLKACNVLPIKKLFSTVKEVCNFVRDSPKRVDLFKKVITEHLPTSKSIILIKLCETRWVESHEAILRFSDMILPIIIFLEDVIGNTDGNILSKCNGLLQSVLNFEFILSLEVAVEILSITFPISRQLQNPDLDLTKCIEMINLVLLALKNNREDTKCTDIFNRAVSKAGVLNIDVKIPRICKRQAHRSNLTTSSTEEYFKITVYFTILDNFITSIQTMFLDNQNNILFKIQQLIPNYLNALSEEDILKGASFYESDLPGTLNELKSEIMLWQLHWAKQPEKNKKSARLWQHLKRLKVDISQTYDNYYLFLPYYL
ncbi:52 kDa repressor of the inhibitor of the protein kinase-like [Acyrthosiphon pisum]|uniref:DUF4371 domain-containing protein n=1 Tax=Acyrthosiphon pisum TaxID=7029 RepID=A0A8R2FCT6_ACYPI|nr:52 kDa repressor of the inhibitor of the protein kinase-like [Acyrthosiphon pisum]|eukprot:XP_008188101.1 PREDICTED: 52 kDa repressor of the inhibitor of the protein kinase-like [Acyrthosiphon pisum]